MPTDEPVPPAPRRPQRSGWLRSRSSRAGWAAVLLLLGFLAAFDWTWFRPLIQYQVHERSGRRIDFDSLRVSLDDAWQPTFVVRHLVVQNAAWAAARPLVRAATFGVTLSWGSLAGDRVVVTRLELMDAELDLERQADGRRNWRLLRPDDRGPGRVRVLAIDASNSQSRYVDQVLGLELELRTTPLTAPVVLPAHAGWPLTKQLALRGARRGTAFDGQLAVSNEVTLFDTARPFALKGEVGVGRSRAALEGSAADLLQLAQLDLGVHIAGPRVADIGALFGLHAALPPLPAQAAANVVKQGPQWRVSALQAQLGHSDLAGELQFDHRPPANGRSTLRARLTSRHIDLAELRASPPAKVVDAASTAASSVAGQSATGTGNIDADLDLAVAEVDGLPLGPLTDLKAQAASRSGRWAVEPVSFAFAGGQATGKLAADTAQSPAAYELALRLQGLHIAQLVRKAPGLRSINGGLDLRIAMHSRGDSAAALARAAAGTVQAELVDATIPDALDAKLALDGGRLLRGLFGGNERSAIVCSALDLRFEAGRGTARRLALETPHVMLTGTGWVDLGQGAVDVVMTPHRKQTALLALDRAVKLSGALRAPKVALTEPVGSRTAPACVPGSAQ